MFAADIQPPCASRARSRLPPHVSFQITAVCENRDPSGPIFPPPLFLKILGKNVRFFPQCPKISRKSWDFHRISLDFSYGLGIFLFFLCIYPKISEILGIAEKKPRLCPTARPEVAPGSPHNAKKPRPKDGAGSSYFLPPSIIFRMKSTVPSIP